MISVTVNGVPHQLDIPEDTPILWALRDHLQMTGTRFGCGVAQCGACTVHLDGNPIRSCSTPVIFANGKSITTIEAMENDTVGQRVQQAWMDEAVAQCGYCQSGQIMSAVALLKSNPNPTDEQINNAMTGNICRCGTYTRIRKAIHTAAGKPTLASNTASANAVDESLFVEVKA